MKIKKPKFWDLSKPNIYAYILYPLSLIIKIINFLKTMQVSKKFKIKTICVGNIYLGGTGKTSLSIKINNILKSKNIKTCFVKKFYENQTDEQKILKDKGNLFVSKNRIDSLIQAEKEGYEVAIFDDGLQDKSIDYDLKIVCFNNLNWIGNGMTIPSGPLRENINVLKKYENVFLNGNLEDLEKLKQYIYNINPNINLYVGKYVPINLNEFKKDEKYIVFSGIGNHNTFVSMVKNNGFEVIREIEFPDHYNYSEKEINDILSEAKKLNCEIITTEKDMSRLNQKYLNKIKILKSELKIIDEDNFIKSVT